MGIQDCEHLEIKSARTLSAFRKYQGLKKYFDAFPPSVRKQIRQWIEQAKTPLTREKRINVTARLAAEKVRADRWR
jgi:uncharacterized protein YdeI (YjbR/CyaY-like superfamily)